MAAPITRQCSCTDDHLCPAATRLRKKAADLLAIVETAEDKDARRESWDECRQALKAYRKHVGRRL